MANFTHLQKLNVTLKTVELPLPQLGPDTVLLVLPATEANKPFYNELLRRASQQQRLLRGGGITSNLLSRNRDADRELYRKYIVKGWRGINNDQGQPVPWSEEAAAEFLSPASGLPDWLFDEIRSFCGEESNFVERTALDTETVAKN